MGSNGSKGSMGNISGVNNTVNFVNSSGYFHAYPDRSIAVAQSTKSNNSNNQMSSPPSLGTTVATRYCLQGLSTNGNKPSPSKSKAINFQSQS